MAFLLSIHSTLLVWRESGILGHAPASEVKIEDLVEVRDDLTIVNGGGIGLKPAIKTDGLNLITPEGKFYCADTRNPNLEPDREVANWWEAYFLISETALLGALNRTTALERERFANRVDYLNKEKLPVKILCGCGSIPKAGFLNLDIAMANIPFSLSNPDEYFIFPFANAAWPIPDNSVDYIFHEDFIEHLTQLEQIQFLSEALRVMKPGAVHRVNTPNLVAAMVRHSDFKKGFDGVYTGELQWGHISILSPSSMTELAGMVGYSKVIFTEKNGGTSAYAVEEYRPGQDRDQKDGNVLADLIK